MSFSELNLVLATPCYGGLVTQHYMQSVMNLMQVGTEAGLKIRVDLLGHDSLITRSRNALVAKFLDSADATHLFFIDADIGFGLDQVARMLRLNEEVVAGMYPLKVLDWDAMRARSGTSEPPEAASLQYVGRPCEGEGRQERDGFVTGLYAGTGFMLLRRSALLRMIEAYPQLRYTSAHTALMSHCSPNQYALFDCMIEPETGHYLSEDYAFCRRWRDIGGTIWLDTTGSLLHVGSHEFAGQPALRFGAGTRGSAA